MINLPESLNLLTPHFLPDQQYYLVGGSVRDTLLQKTSNDLDIICSGDTRVIARKLADVNSGAFFVLDPDRNTSRVILTGKNSEKLVFDFALQRGSTIEEDLLDRDFTINSMVIDLRKPEKILDPLKGARDLQEKWLRPCSENSFQTDPLRIIRAIRYSVAYDLKIEPHTLQLIRNSTKQLESISRERKRDEAFKILENGRSYTALRLLQTLGILPHIGLEVIPDFEAALQRLRILDSFTKYLTSESGESEKEFFILSSLVNEISTHRLDIRELLVRKNLSDRTFKGLNYLAALIWNIPDLPAFLEKIALSKDENDHLVRLINNKRLIHGFFEDNHKILNNRFFHRYFHSLGRSGIDLTFLSLADLAGGVSAELNNTLWMQELAFCAQVVRTWFEKPEIVNPKLLLTGNDLMFEFDLTPGPLIGQLLDGLREEQADGGITTRQQAMDWVEISLMHKRLE